jgi:hypothetical protein
VPLPIPTLPDVIVIHVVLAIACQAHRSAAITLIVPLLPPDGNDWNIGLIE